MPYDSRFSWQHLSLEIYLGCFISSEVSTQSGATYFTSFILARSLGWHGSFGNPGSGGMWTDNTHNSTDQQFTASWLLSRKTLHRWVTVDVSLIQSKYDCSFLKKIREQFFWWPYKIHTSNEEWKPLKRMCVKGYPPWAGMYSYWKESIVSW